MHNVSMMYHKLCKTKPVKPAVLRNFIDKYSDTVWDSKQSGHLVLICNYDPQLSIQINSALKYKTLGGIHMQALDLHHALSHIEQQVLTTNITHIKAILLDTATTKTAKVCVQYTLPYYAGIYIHEPRRPCE